MGDRKSPGMDRFTVEFYNFCVHQQQKFKKSIAEKKSIVLRLITLKIFISFCQIKKML